MPLGLGPISGQPISDTGTVASSVPGGSTVQLSGSTNIVLNAGFTLRRTARLTASANVVFSVVPRLGAIRRISSIAMIVVTAINRVSVVRRLSASASLSLATSSTFVIVRVLHASTSLAFSTLAQGNRVRPLSAAATISVAIQTSIRTVRALRVLANIEFNASSRALKTMQSSASASIQVQISTRLSPIRRLTPSATQVVFSAISASKVFRRFTSQASVVFAVQASVNRLIGLMCSANVSLQTLSTLRHTANVLGIAQASFVSEGKIGGIRRAQGYTNIAFAPSSPLVQVFKSLSAAGQIQFNVSASQRRFVGLGGSTFVALTAESTARILVSLRGLTTIAVSAALGTIKTADLHGSCQISFNASSIISARRKMSSFATLQVTTSASSRRAAGFHGSISISVLSAQSLAKTVKMSATAQMGTSSRTSTSTQKRLVGSISIATQAVATAALHVGLGGLAAIWVFTNGIVLAATNTYGAATINVNTFGKIRKRSYFDYAGEVIQFQTSAQMIRHVALRASTELSVSTKAGSHVVEGEQTRRSNQIAEGFRLKNSNTGRTHPRKRNGGSGGGGGGAASSAAPASVQASLASVNNESYIGRVVGKVLGPLHEARVKINLTFKSVEKTSHPNPIIIIERVKRPS